MPDRVVVGVGAIPIRSGKILLVRRRRDPGAGTWSTPGGFMDVGEDPFACAVRETKEEVGLAVVGTEFVGCTNDVFPGLGHMMTMWVRVGVVSSDPPSIAEPRELDRVEWFELDELPEPLFAPFDRLLRGDCLPPEAASRVFSQPSSLATGQPYRGVILSGRLGSGKTTALRRMHMEKNLFSPTAVTTRTTDRSDFRLSTVLKSAFDEGVRSRELVSPLRFGGEWYAWKRDDFRELVRGSRRFVVTARARLALTLWAVFPGTIAAWLDIGDDARRRQVCERSAERDSEHSGHLRKADDDEDLHYRDLFPVTVRSVDDIVKLLDSSG